MLAATALSSCSDPLDSGEDLFGTGGSAASTGGAFTSGTGGSATGGGFSTGGGSATGEMSATGGTSAAGGAPGSETGGASATGGESNSMTGGNSATGGSLATGGDSDSSTGGSMATGGDSGSPAGGGMATGGDSGAGAGGSGGAACTNIRPTGTDWDEGTCDGWADFTEECGEAWMVDNNYCNQSCGRCDSTGSGGSTSTGGATGTGGGGSNPDWTSVETVCANEIGSQGGFTYEYWKDQGTGCMELGPNGAFSVEWNNINNLLARKSIRPGSANNVVTYAADYQPNGNSYLTVYGWSRSPLVEYYIVDSWGTWRPPGNQGHMGIVTTDGGTYDIYRTQRVNQPSIDGNATFYQYWSVRTTKRTSGTVTVKNHFDAWASHGMNMGTLYEVSMCVEGYQSSGSANVYSLTIQ